MSPSAHYEQHLKESRREAGRLDRQYASSIKALIVLAAFTCVLVYQSWSTHRLPSWTPLLALPVALWSIRRMITTASASQNSRGLREYYEAAAARTGLEWDALDDGAEFLDDEHPYARDLDLFGRGSLFQVLCSARTQAGRETLAAWMKSMAGREESLARREAIAELRGRDDLRVKLATAGRSRVSNCRPETFRMWLNEAVSSFPQWAPVAALLLGLAALALAIAYWRDWVTVERFWQLAAGVGGLELLLAWRLREGVKNVLESVRLPSIELPLLIELLETVERENFTAARLVDLAARLRQGGGASSVRLRNLHRLVSLLDWRINPMFTLVSYPLLWAAQFSMAIERWRDRHGRDLAEWLRALGEFEALMSLATYASEHPADVWPELIEGESEFDAVAMGHPLIDEQHVVRNSVRLDSGTRFLIVSGSNMSGKSTFLRSMGLNTVLAWMGAPVRCERLRVSRLEIAGAIRVQDSLVDGRSHFLAEMQRLRRMIESAERAPLLFLTDEILSGTNSHDRRIVAERVVRALLTRGAIGAITTHDLALTEIAAANAGGRNVHFEDRGEGGELKFDYTLRDGVLTRSNALNIAQMLGIDEEVAPLRATVNDRHPPISGA